jgi:hypothetical protein
MSIPVTQNISPELLEGSSRLVGFAVNRVSIDDLIEGARRKHNRSSLGDYAAHEVMERYGQEIGPAPGSQDSVFSSGVRDAAYYIEGTLTKIPHELSFEQALRIFEQQTTIETLALMAMHANRGDNNIHKLLSEPGLAYMPNLDYSAVVPGVHVTPGPKGCPVAGNYETMTVDPSLLFRKLAMWSGELALRTFHYRDV